MVLQPTSEGETHQPSLSNDTPHRTVLRHTYTTDPAPGHAHHRASQWQDSSHAQRRLDQSAACGGGAEDNLCHGNCCHACVNYARTHPRDDCRNIDTT